MGSAASQMAAVQAEASELHRAFKAQGAAMQATKEFISSVDDKLSRQIMEVARAADAASPPAAAPPPAAEACSDSPARLETSLHALRSSKCVSFWPV